MREPGVPIMTRGDRLTVTLCLIVAAIALILLALLPACSGCPV